MYRKIGSFLKIFIYTAALFSLIVSIKNYNEYENNLFQIKHISVIGNDYISKQEIIESSSLNKGDFIFKVNIKNIKDNIEKIPFVKKAEISIRIPHEIDIKITEQVPIALIINKNKKIFVDSDNNFLVANTKSINNFPVPILNIEEIDIKKNKSISIIKYLYEKYNNMYNNISEISESKSKITLITDKRTKIFLNPKMTISNLKKLKKFEESISVIKNINDYKYINLEFEDQIVVKEKIYS